MLPLVAVEGILSILEIMVEGYMGSAVLKSVFDGEAVISTELYGAIHPDNLPSLLDGRQLSRV